MRIGFDEFAALTPSEYDIKKGIFYELKTESLQFFDDHFAYLGYLLRTHFCGDKTKNGRTLEIKDFKLIQTKARTQNAQPEKPKISKEMNAKMAAFEAQAAFKLKQLLNIK